MRTAYRKLYIETLEAINTENFGCHTTKCHNVALNWKATGIIDTEKREVCQEVVVTIKYNKDSIDIENTEISNADYPHEKEVVLLPNSDIKIEVWQKGKKVLAKKANTGNRVDEWVN